MLIILKKTALPWLVLVATLLFIGEARGQKVYASGTITGGIIPSGLLGAGSPFGLSRSGGGISTVGSIVNFLNIPNNNSSNFYHAGSLKISFGAPTSVGSSPILGSGEIVPILVQANKQLDVILGLAGASSFVQFRYPTNVNEKTTSYIKLKEKPIRNSTVDVATFGVLGLASNNIVSGEVYSGALEPQDYPGSLIPLRAAVVNQNVGTALGNGSYPTKTDLIINKYGEWYAAVTPTASGNYNSVRLTAQFPADLNILSLANTVQFNAYNAFTDPGGTCNFRPMYTTEGTASGIDLSVTVVNSQLDLSKIVKDPTNAIDNDLNTYSAISSGIASVGLFNSVSQSFYFDHKSTATDNLRLQLGLKTSLIDLDLLSLNGIEVKGYNGGSETPTFSKGLYELSQLLSLNLLNLVTINGSSHKKLDLTFKPGDFGPGVIFDRIEIIFKQGVLGVGVLGDALRIYDVSMGTSMPTITLQPTDPLPTSICEGGNTSFTVGASLIGGGGISAYQWEYLDASNNWVNEGAIGPAGATNTLNLNSVTNAMNGRWYRAKITGGTCPQEIYSNEVQLKVNPKAQASDIIAPDVTICLGLSKDLTCNSVTIPNPIFKWYANADLTGLLATGNSYNVSPTTNTSYWVTVEGPATCQNAPSSAKEVKVTVTPHPAPPITIN